MFLRSSRHTRDHRPFASAHPMSNARAKRLGHQYRHFRRVCGLFMNDTLAKAVPTVVHAVFSSPSFLQDSGTAIFPCMDSRSISEKLIGKTQSSDWQTSKNLLFCNTFGINRIYGSGLIALQCVSGIHLGAWQKKEGDW